MEYIEDLINSAKNNLIKGLEFKKPVVTKEAWLINENLIFQDCSFHELRLYGNVFSQEVVFRKCQIDMFHLTSCSFKGQLSFTDCVFLNQFVFDSCNFEKLVTFRRNEFHNGINLFCKGGEKSGSVEFNGGVLIQT